MRQFKQYLYEQSIPNLDKTLGAARKDMPQLTKFDDFKSDLEANGFAMQTHICQPYELTPTQSQFNQSKVDMLKHTGDWSKRPIITSSDGYVVDGHHRWLAAHQLNRSIECRQVPMSIDSLLDFLKEKPYIHSKTLTEQHKPQ